LTMAARDTKHESRREQPCARAGGHHLVVVPVLLVELFTPDVPLPLPMVLLPVPDAPIELVPLVPPVVPVVPVVPVPPALFSVVDVLPVVLPLVPAVFDGLVGELLEAEPVPACFEQAPSDRAATTATTAAAVWVREVFIRETPKVCSRVKRGSAPAALCAL